MESIRDSLAEELVKMTAQVHIDLFSFEGSELSSYLLTFTLICSESIEFTLLYVPQCEKLRAEAAMLPGVRAELDALRRRHAAALELMGERDEEVNILLQFDGIPYSFD